MPWALITKAVGLGEGGVVRGAFDALMGLVCPSSGRDADPAYHSTAFTIAFVSLAAKMAKADGCVADVEAATFHELYEVRPEEVTNVQRVFEFAAQDTSGYEVYARQIARTLKDEPRLLRDVFDGLFHIAAADGIIHPGEDRFLRDVAKIFGIGASEFGSIRAAFVQEAGGAEFAGGDPYEILGVEPRIPADELKARHRQLVREHHPDSLVARGVPPAFHAAAGRKLAVINAAYDNILKARGLKVPVSSESSAR